MLSTPTFVAQASLPRPSLEDELAETIELALRSTGYLELQHVEVTVSGHDVLLRGRVPSYFMKQKAEFLVRCIPGVATLKSEIEVTKG